MKIPTYLILGSTGGIGRALRERRADGVGSLVLGLGKNRGPASLRGQARA